MDIEREKPAIIISMEDFNKLETQLKSQEPEEYIEPEYLEEGGGIPNKMFFVDEDYKPLNKGCFIYLFLVSEALKEINDSEYSVNSENFVPNTKQTNIINLIKTKFKNYLEIYRKIPVNELKMKLNILCVEFLKILDKETIQTIYKTLLKNIFEQRKKQLRKNIEDYKKYYETEIFKTIETEEAEKLSDKLCRPIKEIVKELIDINTVKKIDIEKTINKIALKKSIKNNAPSRVNLNIESKLKEIEKINNELPKFDELDKIYEKFDENNFEYDDIKTVIKQLKQTITKYKEIYKVMQASKDKYDKISIYKQLIELKRSIYEKQIEIEKLINKTQKDRFIDKYQNRIEAVKRFEKNTIDIYNYYKKGSNLPVEGLKYTLQGLLITHQKIQELIKDLDDYKAVSLIFDKLTPKEQEEIKDKFDIFNKPTDEFATIDTFENKEINIFTLLGTYFIYLYGKITKQDLINDNPKIYENFIKEDVLISYDEDLYEELKDIYIDEDEDDIDKYQKIINFESIIKDILETLNIIRDNKYINTNIKDLDASATIGDDIIKQLEKLDIKKYDDFIIYFKNIIPKIIKEFKKVKEVKEDDKPEVKEDEDAAKAASKPKGEDIVDDKKDDVLHLLSQIEEEDKKNGDGIKKFNINKNELIKVSSGGSLINEKQPLNAKEKMIKTNPSFDPPTRPKKDTINNINNRRKIRDVRITNYNRKKIQNSINDLNNNIGLYDKLNPNFLNALSQPQGGGTFFTKKVNKIINNIKQEAKKI